MGHAILSQLSKISEWFFMSDTLVIFEEWENLREKGFQKKFKFLKKVLDKQEIV